MNKQKNNYKMKVLKEYISQVKDLHSLNEYIKEQLSDVQSKWHPKEGLFTGDNPQKIADYLLRNSKDEAQAMQRLCFYMNRAGDKLTNRTVLNKVKQILKSKKVNEKLVVNKDYKEQYTYKPHDISGLYFELKKRVKEQGPGTRMHPLDFNDIDVSNMNMLGFVFSFASKNADEHVLMKYIDISEWDVSNVENFSGMFENCEDLVSVGDLSKWKIRTDEHVTFEQMFRNCSNLKYIGDISTWDVSSVNNIIKMFSGCSKLTDIGDLSNWKIDPDTTSRRMFLHGTPAQLKRNYDWLQ